MPLSESQLRQLAKWISHDKPNGGNCAPFSENGKPTTLQLTSVHEPLASPVGISSFGPEETIRKSLELRRTPDLEAFAHRLDAWTRGYLPDNAERMFKGRTID